MCRRAILIIVLLLTTAMGEFDTYESLITRQESLWNDTLLQMPEVYGPGQVIKHAERSDDNCTVATIEKILSSYRFTHKYDYDVFSCNEMSIITWYILSRNGIKPYLVFWNNDTIAHQWVAVKGRDGKWIMIETTKEPLKNIGHVVTCDDRYYKDCWLFNSSAERNVFLINRYLLYSSNEYDLPVVENPQ